MSLFTNKNKLPPLPLKEFPPDQLKLKYTASHQPITLHASAESGSICTLCIYKIHINKYDSQLESFDNFQQKNEDNNCFKFSDSENLHYQSFIIQIVYSVANILC